MARTKFLFGNWKMNHLISETKKFASEVGAAVTLAKEKNIEIGVAPSFLSLQTMAEANTGLIIASQDVHFSPSGAFTGFVSIPMIKELGINWTILGHSERRLYANEISLTCNQKIHACLENDVKVIYCVGETLAQFEGGLTRNVVKEQMIVGLMNLKKEDVSNIVIAYEPVWSIGTGKNASEEIAEDVCGYIRSLVAEMFDQETADKVRILYGGSVKPNNIHSYMTCPDIDGALVGGASLKAESFIELVKNI